MRLLSWNVQWCRGIDERVDPKRIAAVAKRFADPDVFCLQEIARNFPEMAGSSGEDQVAILQAEFGGYEAFFAPAVDLPGKKGRRQFGNLILSRLPVGRVIRHHLPWPALADQRSMPRGAVEVTVDGPFGPLRVTTTHLDTAAPTRGNRARPRDAQGGQSARRHRSRAYSTTRSARGRIERGIWTTRWRAALSFSRLLPRG